MHEPGDRVLMEGTVVSVQGSTAVVRMDGSGELVQVCVSVCTAVQESAVQKCARESYRRAVAGGQHEG